MREYMTAYCNRFDLDWACLLVAWRGMGRFNQLIDTADVRDFAWRRMADAREDDPEFMLAIRLLDALWDDVERLLADFLENHESALHLARRKWVACLLEMSLNQFAEVDYLPELAFCDFWTSIPLEDHEREARIQGLLGGYRGTDILISGLSREALMSRHRVWLIAEYAALGAKI